MNLDLVWEGPPGHVHGGYVAYLYDCVMGHHNIAVGVPGMTGTLRVRFRRPTPLYRARRLSQHYGKNSKIYLKREDLNHTGAHKINNCLGQILLASRMGKTRIVAETGAGQHGVATATVAALFDMKCTVYMGELDMERQKPNVVRMNLLGTEVVPVASGSRTL